MDTQELFEITIKMENTLEYMEDTIKKLINEIHKLQQENQELKSKLGYKTSMGVNL